MAHSKPNETQDVEDPLQAITLLDTLTSLQTFLTELNGTSEPLDESTNEEESLSENTFNPSSSSPKSLSARRRKNKQL